MILNKSCYIAENGNCGSIVGYNYGTIKNCISEVFIVIKDGGAYNAGGIAGCNNGKIVNCINLGKINGKATVGGIAGSNNQAGSIENCINIGDVYGNATIGGISGAQYTTSGEPVIKNCYNFGTVTLSSGTAASIGGIVGINGYSTKGGGYVTSCYFWNDSCSIGVGSNAYGIEISNVKGVAENASGDIISIETALAALNANVDEHNANLAEGDVEWKHWNIDENGIPSFL